MLMHLRIQMIMVVQLIHQVRHRPQILLQRVCTQVLKAMHLTRLRWGTLLQQRVLTPLWLVQIVQSVLVQKMQHC